MKAHVIVAVLTWHFIVRELPKGYAFRFTGGRGNEGFMPWYSKRRWMLG